MYWLLSTCTHLRKKKGEKLKFRKYITETRATYKRECPKKKLSIFDAKFIRLGIDSAVVISVH